MTSGNGEAFNTHTNTPGFRGVTGLPNNSGLVDKLLDCTVQQRAMMIKYYLHY